MSYTYCLYFKIKYLLLLLHYYCCGRDFGPERMQADEYYHPVHGWCTGEFYECQECGFIVDVNVKKI